MQLWNIGARFVDSKQPTFMKIVKNCLLRGVGIRSEEFAEKAAGWCGRLICEKMRSLWNNVTSKYRERIKHLGTQQIVSSSALTFLAFLLMLRCSYEDCYWLPLSRSYGG